MTHENRDGNREFMAKDYTHIYERMREFVTDGTPLDVIARYARLPEEAASADYGELDTNVVVIDTETTGISYQHDQLTQIAAARLEKGEITDWFITFVNPRKPIPEDVAHLTNITDEDVADAPTPSEALAELVEFVGDAKLVAHNADFDRNFVTKTPSGYPLLENQWIDSLDLARIALPRLQSHRLIDLVQAFDAPLSTHRADADVAATCALYRILLAGITAMPGPLVRKISELTTSEEWPTAYVFQQIARLSSEQDDASEASRSSVQDAVRDATEETAQAADAATTRTPSLTFSLRNVRRSRVGELDLRAKPDASSVLESALQQASGHASLTFPSEEDISAAFSPEGLLGSLYPDYEQRSEQQQMAQAVRTAFATSTNLVVEAGTGVGKSMAYLVPLARTAKANGITVGIATKTNALLDQLIYHELPALADAMAHEADARNKAADALTFAALKGFPHYLCLRRAEQLLSQGPSMCSVGQYEKSSAPALAALLSFIEQTEYDDIDTLKVDSRLIPRKLYTTTSRQCLRRKCPFFGDACFVHGARRKAEASDIVVTNHSLFFCDLAADRMLLPPIRFWVVDEAHGAESEARRAFSLELSVESLKGLAGRVDASESSRNVFIRAERTVTVPDAESSGTLFYALTAKAKAAGKAYADAAGEFCAHLRDLLFFDAGAGRKAKSYDVVELWVNDEMRRSTRFGVLQGYGRALIEATERLVSAAQELVGYLEECDGAGTIQREIASIALEGKQIIEAAEVILLTGGDQYVYAASLCRKNERMTDKLEALLFNVGGRLDETLYASTFSVVYTSATLTVEGGFKAFEDAMGLNASEDSRTNELLLASSYDFDEHMVVYVPDDIPEPTDPTYLPHLRDLLVRAHLARGGSLLTLFTNKREMERCFEEVRPALKDADLRLLCQKWGLSTKGLRDEFLTDEHLSLFALKSFWEGFDAPGATLKGVVIAKLPFSKPTDPLSCERNIREERAWKRYVLPQAVIEVKQAAGRLIRKADDEGFIILADKRLLTKSYGNAFLASLPSKNIRVCSTDDIIADISAASAAERTGDAAANDAAEDCA